MFFPAECVSTALLVPVSLTGTGAAWQIPPLHRSMLSVKALCAGSTPRPGSHCLKQQVDLFVQVEEESLGLSGASGTD